MNQIIKMGKIEEKQSRQNSIHWEQIRSSG